MNNRDKLNEILIKYNQVYFSDIMISKIFKSEYNCKTMKEAKAFIAGIEFVNDSSLEVYYRGKHLGGYMVRIDERIEVL